MGRAEQPGVPRVWTERLCMGPAGSIGGLVLGILGGLAFMTPGRFGFWMVVIGTTIFFGAVCAFTAGIASLDTPAPGDEPAGTAPPPGER